MKSEKMLDLLFLAPETMSLRKYIVIVSYAGR